MRGAGKLVPPKRFRIGVKNHGLKACFKLGDDISLLSAGLLVRQTLYCDGPDSPPRPGAFRLPVPDSNAPSSGCRITVPFRTKRLATLVGEPLEFAAPSRETIDTIFAHACQEIPAKFIGVVRPGIREAYSLELSHHTHGKVIFTFRCTPGKRSRRGWTFNRTCFVSGDIAGCPPNLCESAFIVDCELPAGSVREIPQFYAARKGFCVEVAWPVNSRGTAIPSQGRIRYPIAYSTDGQAARTGLAASYSGPFVSDQERHGITDAEFNAHLMSVCDSIAIRLLRDHLLQKRGPESLRLFVDSSGEFPERLRMMTGMLLSERALPLARRLRSRLQLGPRLDADGTPRPVVVPSYSWAPDTIVRVLSSLCPTELDQIDPRVPKEIISLLGGRTLDGWKDTHVTFDEDDVLERLQPACGEAYFEWSDDREWQRCLAETAFVRRCLDVVLASTEKTEKKDTFSPEKVKELRGRFFLPDTDNIARPLDQMFVGNELPHPLALLRKPWLLNQHVAAHPLLKRRPWRPRTYSLSTFLEDAELEKQPESTRRAFFGWLRSNFKSVPRRFEVVAVSETNS
jgi:hypothetical protein